MLSTKCRWCGSSSQIMTQKTPAKWKNVVQRKLNQCEGVACTIPRFENLPTYIKKGVSQIQPNSVEDLWKAVQKIWGFITVERCQHLVDSMGSRMGTV